MANRRRYKLSRGGYSVTFDNSSYILESIDLGTVQEELETAQYQMKSVYTTSRLSTRDIDIVGWCATGQYSDQSAPSRELVESRKSALQNVCIPLSEITLSVEGLYRDSISLEYTEDWYTVFTIKVRLAESIEWGTSLDSNNPFACKFAIHLVALDPFFEAKLYNDGTVAAPEYYRLTPYGTSIPGSKLSVANISYSSGQSKIAYGGSLNSLGHTPKFYPKGIIHPTATGTLTKVRIYEYSSEVVSYTIPSVSVGTSSSINFDLDTMVLTIGSTKYYPDSTSKSVYLDSNFSNLYIDLQSGASHIAHTVELTKGPVLLEV